jgi:hypothetical protein
MIGRCWVLFPFSSASLVSRALDRGRSCRVGTFPFSGLTGVKIEMGEVLFTVKVVGVDLQ